MSVYLNVGGGFANDTRFDWDSALNDASGNFRRDFVFNAGYYNDSDATGTGPRFVISASNNAGRGSAFPKNPGRDPFGGPTRGVMSPAEIVDLLGEVGGVCGVNFLDNDLVPIDATGAEAAGIKEEFTRALKRTKLKVAMATTNLRRAFNWAVKQGILQKHCLQTHGAVNVSIRARGRETIIADDVNARILAKASRKRCKSGQLTT